ncbi:MAG: hypothetical protein AAGA99_00835 [Actinomycetota bacterium]
MSVRALVTGRPLLGAIRYPDDPEWTPARCEVADDARAITVDGPTVRSTGDAMAVALLPGLEGVLAVPFVVSDGSAVGQVVQQKVRVVPRIEIARSPVVTMAAAGAMNQPPRLDINEVRLLAVEGSDLRVDGGRHRITAEVGVLQIGAGDRPLPLLVELRQANDGGGTVARLAEPTPKTVVALSEQTVRLVVQGAARPGSTR